MTRKAVYIMRTFAGTGDIARGTLEHEGGSHVCYWHAPASTVPPPGEYQILMHDAHFSLLDHPAEIRAVGHGRGIELGRILHADRVALHGEHIIAYLQGLHRTRDAAGTGTCLEVR